MRFTHGMTGQRPYRIWDTMIQRCTNPKRNSYRNYGARGIKVCDRWMRFENFWEDTKDGYGHHLTLDRINNNGDYEPGNVRWATYRQQHNNRKDNVRWWFDGEGLTCDEWARRTGINRNTLYARLHKLGWSVRDTVTTPSGGSYHGVRC